MIEVNKNTLASALPVLGKLICRTSPLALCKSVKVEAAEGKLRLSTCGVNEEVSFELETGGDEVFSCLVGFDEFRDAVKSGSAGVALRMPVLASGSLAETERRKIMAVLEKNGGNRTRAAEELGISRRTLHRKLREYRAAEENEGKGGQ